MNALACALLALLSQAVSPAPVVQTRILELRVYEPDGTLARVTRNQWSAFDSNERILYCVRCPKGETPRAWLDTPEGTSGNKCIPSRGFVVVPGERYVYAYVGKDIQPIEGEVTIGLQDPITVRELRVEPACERGTVHVHRLTRPDGSLLQHDFQVSVESLATGLTLFRATGTNTTTQYEDLLPVGRYRLRVATEEGAPFCGTGWTPEPAPFGDWVTTFEVKAGATTPIDARMWRGGKLRLALALPEGMTPRADVWSRQFPPRGEPPEADWLYLGMRGPGARVTLRTDPDGHAGAREPGMPEVGAPVRFFMPKLIVAYQTDAILPGDEQTSADWIPPGDYIARVEARDFAPVETKVTIRVDETTALRVQLAPR